MRLSRTLGLLALVLVGQTACHRSGDGAAASSADLASGTTLAPAMTLPVSKSGPAYSEQSGAAIALGGGQYLAAWTELHLATQRSTVSLTRIGADGALLDERGIALPMPATGDAGSVALASDGTDFLAVWSQKAGNASIIAGVRVGADGKVKSLQPFHLGRTSGRATSPAVAYAPGGYLVTWIDDRDAGASADQYVTEVYGARISTAGGVVGSAEGFRITEATGTLEESLSVAAAGSTFLVGYAKHAGSATIPHAVRVSDGGAVLDAIPLAFGAGGDLGSAPSVATDGAQFFVAWNDAASRRVAGTRVSKEGAKLDDSPIAIGADEPAAPAVAWDGDAFSIAWGRRAKRVAPTGVVLDSALTSTTSAASAARPAIAGTGASVLVVRAVVADPARGLPSRVEGDVLPKSGGAASVSGLGLARGSSLQKDVATAAHGKTSMSVWLEYEDAYRPKVVGVLYDGASVRPLTVDAGAAPGNAAPAIVWDGSAYAVAWENATGSEPRTSVVRVREDGAVVDAPVSFAGGLPRLTAGGSGQVLVTTSAAAATRGWFLDRPSADGSPAVEVVAEPTGSTTSPVGAPVWDGSRYVLAWSASRGAGTAEIHAQRFDKTGRAMDIPAVKIATLPLPAGAVLPKVTLATNGLDTLIAFDDPTTHRILGARLSGSGVLDAVPARLDSGTAGFAFEPRLAWDGGQWTLAYERRPDPTRVDAAGYPLEITRVRASAAGLALAGPPETITWRGLRPAIAGGTKGATFLGYEAIGAEDIAGPRVAVTLFTDDTSTPPPPSSSSGSSSGGTTAPGDDDDDTGPIAPSGDDDDGVTKKPSAPKPPPTKGATVKPGATSGASSDEGGCVAAPSGAAGSASPVLLFAALGALFARRRRAR